MLRSRAVAVLAVALAVGTMAAACGNGEEGGPETLVPQGTAMVAEVSLPAILGSEGLAAIVNAIGGDVTLDSAVDRAYQKTGLDVRQISQVVVFGRDLFGLFTDADLGMLDGPISEEPFLGAIVGGSLDRQAAVAAMEELGSLTDPPLDYKSHQVYVYLFGGTSNGPELALAFPDEDVAVVGTANAVFAVIDVYEGDAREWSGPLRNAFDGIGPGLFRLAWDLSGVDLPGLFTGPGGSGDQPAVFTALGDLDLLTLGVAQNGEIMVLRMDHDYGAAESAEVVGDLVEGQARVTAAVTDTPSARELLERLEVDRKGSHLTLRLEAQASLIASLVSHLTGASEQMEPQSKEYRYSPE